MATLESLSINGQEDKTEIREEASENEDMPAAQATRGSCECKTQFSCLDLLPAPLASRIRRLKEWIWEDLSKPHLIWIKLIFFFQSASLVVLYPYLVIHMRSLGLSTEEIAVVNGVLPAADMVGPPLAGFLADKIGNFRVFMSGLTLVSGAASLLLLLIPPKNSLGLVSHSLLTCCPLPGQTWHCSDETANATYLASRLSELPPPVASASTSTSSSFLTCINDLDQQVALAVSSLSEQNNSSQISDTCFEVSSCTGSFSQPHPSWTSSLWAYIALRATIDVLRASSCMMFEGAVVITIKQMGGDYGLQKLFGTFGAIIWGPVSGQIIDMASQSTGSENYAPVFWTFFAMRTVCAILILKLNLSFKQPAKKVFKNLWKLIMQPHIFMFLVIFFICGAVWGFLESYLFWFLEDLGSTKLTMGISLAVGTIAGVPLTIGSGYIIRKLGNNNVIVLALALYSFRLLGYSFINFPMESLFFEFLKPFGNSLLMIAAMTYAKSNADISTMASLEGVMGALYFGVGKALGSLSGGLAIESIGVRNTFRCFSVASLVAASVYLFFTQLYDKRQRQKKGPEKDLEEKSDEVQEVKKDPEITTEDQSPKKGEQEGLKDEETRCT